MISLLARTIGVLAMTAFLPGCAHHTPISRASAGSLTGVLHDERGRLVSHALVEVAALDWPGFLAADTTDERGRFRLVGLARGSYRMRVVRIGLRQLIWVREIHASSSDSLELTLLNSDRGLLICSPPPGVGLQLVLRDAQTGRFVAEGVVAVAEAASYADTLRRSFLSSGLGVPVYEGIPAGAGAYQVSVRHPGYEEVRFPVLIEAVRCGVTPVLREVFLVPKR